MVEEALGRLGKLVLRLRLAMTLVTLFPIKRFNLTMCVTQSSSMCLVTLEVRAEAAPLWNKKNNPKNTARTKASLCPIHVIKRLSRKFL